MPNKRKEPTMREWLLMDAPNVEKRRRNIRFYIGSCLLAAEDLKLSILRVRVDGYKELRYRLEWEDYLTNSQFEGDSLDECFLKFILIVMYEHELTEWPTYADKNKECKRLESKFMDDYACTLELLEQTLIDYT